MCAPSLLSLVFNKHFFLLLFPVLHNSTDKCYILHSNPSRKHIIQNKASLLFCGFKEDGLEITLIVISNFYKKLANLIAIFFFLSFFIFFLFFIFGFFLMAIIFVSEFGNVGQLRSIFKG